MANKPRINSILFVFLFACAASVMTAPIWEKGEFKFFLENNVLEIDRGDSPMAVIESFEFNFIRPDSISVESVKTDTLVLNLRFSESDGFHADFPSHIFLAITEFDNSIHFFTAHKSFEHVSITLKDRNEHYFGLVEKCYPGNSKNPDLRGNVVDVDVYGNGSLDYAENYASAYSAFYTSSAGYGSFFDTFAKGRYQFAINGMTRIHHQTGSLDWYLFYGPTGEKIHKEYFKVIGRPKFVPLWALGPIFWRDLNRGGKDEVLEDIRKFTDMKIPLTACWVDRPYSHGANEWSKMDFADKFAGPEQWIRTINEKYGMQFMTWVGPMTFQDQDFPGLLPGNRGYMDLTSPEALEQFGDRLTRNQYSAGVKGHKMDRADENFPLTAPWRDPVTESESRNKYVYLYSKTIDGFLSKAHGRDQFNFARAAFHRCQPFLSAVWGGDSRSNWQGLSGSQANAMRSGFMGFPVWGSDTGGYLGPGRIDEELYIRWLQWGTWNGMFEIKIDGSGGEGEDRPPWKYPNRLQEIFRKACELRMDLLPTLYSCANTSYLNGVLMKPLASQYPEDERTYSIWDEYLFCDAFLVAPVFSKSNSREIYLPRGTWIDFNDPAKEYAGPITLQRNVPLEQTPVFIKRNSIYVTGQIYRGNSKVWKGDLKGDEKLVIHAFPGVVNDSVTFNYVDCFDHDSVKDLSMIRQNDKIIFTSDAIQSPVSLELRCETKPVRILLNDRKIRFAYDSIKKAVRTDLLKNQAVCMEVFFSR